MVRVSIVNTSMRWYRYVFEPYGFYEINILNSGDIKILLHIFKRSHMTKKKLDDINVVLLFYYVVEV